jgi:hypothetical protein
MLLKDYRKLFIHHKIEVKTENELPCRKHPFQIPSPGRATDGSPGSGREADATRGNDPQKTYFFVIRPREGG